MKNFFKLVIFILALALQASCNSYPAAEQRVVEYKCDDVVVIGRAKTLNYTNLDIEGDILGRSLFDMEINIKRVLRGTEKRPVVKASAVAHSQLRDDVDFVFVLAPENENYTVESGYAWNPRPRPILAESCIE